VHLAFDGANIWVADNASNTVTTLRASDGTCNGVANPPGSSVTACSFAVGSNLFPVAFDGANIWVTDYNSSTFSKRYPTSANRAGGSMRTVRRWPHTVLRG